MRSIDKYDKKFLVEILKDMILGRRFEEEVGKAYGMRKFGGFLHLYIGQEAVSTGICAAIQKGKDVVTTAYRDHTYALSLGVSANACMAELFGKSTGVSKGKGGSMHFFDKAKGLYGGHGIVGGQIPPAAGVAWSMKYSNQKAVSICLFGDGAIHQGAFHETLNMAKLWKLPVLYICENNGYAMGTSLSRGSSIKDLYKKGDSYGIESKQINGMDVIEVYETIKEIAEKMREDNEPRFLEILTYRYRGHSASDPAKYRTKEEEEEYKTKKDPIINLKNAMIEKKLITEADYEAMDDEAKKISKESYDYAEKSPEPDYSEIMTDIYSTKL